MFRLLVYVTTQGHVDIHLGRLIIRLTWFCHTTSERRRYTVEMYVSAAKVHLGLAMTLTFDVRLEIYFRHAHSHDEHLYQVSL